MSLDRLGLPITIGCPQTRAAFDVYQQDWVQHGPRVRSIVDAADQDETSCIVNAHAAAVCMAQESSVGFKLARKYLMRARARARDANERERAFGAAVYAWWRGKNRDCLLALRDLVVLTPRDVVAAKWAQYHAFNLGDSSTMLEVSGLTLASCADVPEAWGLQAFALEATGDVDGAESAARAALAMEPNEVWAQHSMAHVYAERGDLEGGARFLKSKVSGWRDRSVFIRQHNHWHLALFYLELGKVEKALELYDRELWGRSVDLAQEQIGAISFLWRLDLLGVDVGNRWDEVSRVVAGRWHEHLLPFHDIHFMYALLRGRRRLESEAFMASLERRGQADVTGVWESLVVPCARGLAHFVGRRYSHAAQMLEPLVVRLPLIGGSRVQRQVIIATLAEARRRAERAPSPGRASISYDNVIGHSCYRLRCFNLADFPGFLLIEPSARC